METSNAKTLYFVALLAAAVALPYFFLPAPKPTKSGHAAPAPTAVRAAEVPKTEGPVLSARAPGRAEDPGRLAAQKTARIETDSFSAKIGGYNGGLTSFRLKGKRFAGRGREQAVDIVSTQQAAFLPLAIEIDGLAAQNPSDWELTQLSARGVELRRDEGGLRVSRKLEAGKHDYQLWVTTLVSNIGSTPRKIRLRVAAHHYVTHESEGANVPLLPVRSWETSNGLCRHAGSLERQDGKKLIGGQQYADDVEFTGVENGYFLSAIAPDSGDVESCRIEASERGLDPSNGKPLGALFSARLVYREFELAPGATKNYRTLAYLGPKSPEALAAAGHSLKGAIASGWFTTLAEGLTWLLSKIEASVGNWGLAIILLTFVVKLVLFPLTAKQMQSMARMKELKPELDRIAELYGDDREKKGAAIMELYRKRGVNPMAGCFPVLLQLPIWFSLYASLSSNVELFRAPFALWWTDLSMPDHFFILPLALGALMFVQQKISPAAGVDPMQQKMMLYMMPTMMTSFMLFLPSGLCLYMFTNSALSIGQQRLIEARLKHTSSVAISAESGPSSPDESRPGESVDEDNSDIPDNHTQKSGRASKAERRSRRDKR
jgi:YidC/Oxa1 family membrane protein insertase